MSANICPVVKLGEPTPIPGADKIEVFNVEGSGPCVCARGDFVAGDLASFIPPETMVDTKRSDFAFLAKSARKSDGWAKVRPVRLRGQLSVGLLMRPAGLGEGDNAAEFYQVKKPEDFETIKVEQKAVKKPTFLRRLYNKIFGDKEEKRLWPGIPVYDINQLYKMPKNLFADDELIQVTEKLHGTNARFVIGKDGKLWCGSRTMWRVYNESNVYGRAAVEGGIEAKLRRLAEPLVLWGEIVGPRIQKGFHYGLKENEIKFYAFDFYHCGERRFLDPTETNDICHWLHIDRVPMVSIDHWKHIKDGLLKFAADPSAVWRNVMEPIDHPREGIVVRPWKNVKESHALDGSRCLVAGKVINPAYLEFREKPGMDENIII